MDRGGTGRPRLLRRALASIAAGAWACLLLGSDCLGYYPVRRDAGPRPDAPFDAPADARARPDAPFDAARAPDGPVARSWERYEVAPTPRHPYGHGGDPRLVIDDAGTFHVAHTSAITGEVSCSHGVPGGFETEVVGREAVADFVHPAAIAVVGETLHLAYATGGAEGAVHAWRRGAGPWESEALAFEPGPPAAAHPAIALLPGGAPVFVGIGATTDDGVTARTEVRALGLGAPETVARTGSWIDEVDVAFADGHVNAIFPGTDSRFFTLATRYDDGAWSTGSLRANLASIAAAPDGSLGVTCVRRAVSGGEVVWAVFAGGGDPGLEEVLPLASEDVQRIDAAIASDGTVHLAAEMTDTVGTLAYVTNASGSWVVEAVERAWGSRPSIALDGGGRPWIAYRDSTSHIVVATPAR